MPSGLGAVLVISATHHVQYHMMRPFVPLYAASIGVDYVGVGVVAASVALLPIFLALPTGVLADRVGVRASVTAGASLSVAATLLLWMAGSSFAVIVVAQMITGVAQLFMAIGVQSYVGSLGGPGAAARNFSYYTVIASLGHIVGPLAGGFIVEFAGFRAAFLAAAGLASVSVVTGLLLMPRRSPTSASPEPIAGRASNSGQALSYLRNPRMRAAILISSLMSIPEVLRNSFLPIYLDVVVGLGLQFVGGVLSVFSLTGLVARLLVPTLARRLGAYPLMTIVGLVTATALALIPTTAAVVVIAGLVAALGAAFGIGRPLSMALTAESAERDRMGLAVGLRLTGNRVSDFTAPLIFGATAALWSVGGAFFVGAGLVALGTGVVARQAIAELRGRRRDDPPPSTS